MRNKTLKVGEKSVLKLYGSTIQVLIKRCKKVDGGWKYVGEINAHDAYNPRVGRGITIRGFVDDNLDYGN